MKIQLKSTLISELSNFHEKTKDISETERYMTHPDFKIGLRDYNLEFKVSGIEIQWSEEFYIHYDDSFTRIFTHFPRKYFDIVDTSIPNTWWVGWFPRWNISFWSDIYEHVIHYDQINISENKKYYWGYPILFSHEIFEWLFYNDRSIYLERLHAYLKLEDLPENSKIFSIEEIENILDLIRALP